MFTNICKSFLILTKFYKNKKIINNIYKKKKDHSISKKPFHSNLQLPKIKQDCPSFSLSSIKSKTNNLGNYTNGFISSNLSINKESNNSMRTNIFNLINVLTPNTINAFNSENYIIKKLMQNGNYLCKDYFNNNDLEKVKFKESYNHSFYEKTPNFSISKDDDNKNNSNNNTGRGMVNSNCINIENVLFNNFDNEKEKNSIGDYDYNNYVNIKRKGNVLTIIEKNELKIIIEDDKDEKDDKENNNDNNKENNNDNENDNESDNESDSDNDNESHNHNNYDFVNGNN